MAHKHNWKLLRIEVSGQTVAAVWECSRRAHEMRINRHIFRKPGEHLKIEDYGTEPTRRSLLAGTTMEVLTS